MQSGEAMFRATADHLAVHTIVKDGGQWLVQQLPGSLDVALYGAFLENDECGKESSIYGEAYLQLYVAQS